MVNGLFAPNLLQRQKATTSQAGLNHAQRKQSLARAFQLDESGKVAVREHYTLLIDNVMTNSATLNKVVQTLTRAGRNSVSASAIGRVR